MLLLRGVDYHAGLQSFKSTPTETVHLDSIDWPPACIVERKIVPATQFEVKQRKFFAVADSMAVLGGRARIFRCAGEKKGNSRGIPLLTSKHGD